MSVPQPRVKVFPQGPRIETAPDSAHSLAQRAYVTLRDQIVSLQIPPGTALDDQVLSRTLRMSRTPLREALQRLALDELVQIIPRRGTFVREVEARHLGQLSEIRAHLESLAASLAASRFDHTSDSPELAELVAALDGLASPPDPGEMIALDRGIHHFVYSHARNSMLEAALSRYYYLTLRIWFLALDRLPSSTLEDTAMSQRKLLLAIEAGDRDLAATIAAEHVTSFERDVRDVL